jgi:hypothetical protein
MKPVPGLRIALLVVVCLGAGQPVCVAQAPSAVTSEPQLFAENVISTADDESHPAFTPRAGRFIF